MTPSQGWLPSAPVSDLAAEAGTVHDAISVLLPRLDSVSPLLLKDTYPLGGYIYCSFKCNIICRERTVGCVSVWTSG